MGFGVIDPSPACITCSHSPLPKREGSRDAPSGLFGSLCDKYDMHHCFEAYVKNLRRRIQWKELRTF